MPLIREATADDYEAVCTLYDGLDAYHAGMDPERFQSLEGPARPSAHFRAFLEEPDRVFYVADDNGTLIGLVNCRVTSSPPFPMFKARTLVALENIFVDDKRRRQGIGTALLSKAREWAWRKGADAMQVAVYCCNDAGLAFSRKHGFSDVKKTLETTVGPAAA